MNRSDKIMGENENKKFDVNVMRKPYSKPEIVHELELETRAGSPLGGFPDSMDLPE
jgi:hypothetical protein